MNHGIISNRALFIVALVAASATACGDKKKQSAAAENQALRNFNQLDYARARQQVIMNPNSAYNQGLQKRNLERTKQRAGGNWGSSY